MRIPSKEILEWPHAPVHWFRNGGAYIVTAGTYGKEPLFHSPERLNYLANALMILAEEYAWQLQAWAIFPSHYDFIAASDRPDTLGRLIQYLHSIAAKHINLLDRRPGRKA